MRLLDALKTHTELVATTADADIVARATPRDASIDDAAVLHALRQPAHAPLLAETLAAHAGEPLPDLADASRCPTSPTRCACASALPCRGPCPAA